MGIFQVYINIICYCIVLIIFVHVYDQMNKYSHRTIGIKLQQVIRARARPPLRRGGQDGVGATADHGSVHVHDDVIIGGQDGGRGGQDRAAVLRPADERSHAATDPD